LAAPSSNANTGEPVLTLTVPGTLKLESSEEVVPLEKIPVSTKVTRASPLSSDVTANVQSFPALRETAGVLTIDHSTCATVA